VKQNWNRLILPAVLLTALVASGCASKKYVRTELDTHTATSTERMDGIEGQVESNQTRLDLQQEEIVEISQTAQDALDRAIAAGLLAEGKFLYETVLSDDKVRFAFNQSTISPDGMAALDQFVSELRARDENVFIEIQGHTDSVGDDAFNMILGERRAQEVRRYLSQTGGLALHRMSVISYGKTAPIADNATPEGRAMNRRVTLVVLQ
jgi:outer membrane protein OmpA-like peptidoglycan-associated protein